MLLDNVLAIVSLLVQIVCLVWVGVVAVRLLCAFRIDEEGFPATGSRYGKAIVNIKNWAVNLVSSMKHAPRSEKKTVRLFGAKEQAEMEEAASK